MWIGQNMRFMIYRVRRQKRQNGPMAAPLNNALASRKTRKDAPNNTLTKTHKKPHKEMICRIARPSFYRSQAQESRDKTNRLHIFLLAIKQQVNYSVKDKQRLYHIKQARSYAGVA